MDILAIFSTIRRHKLITFLMILITLGGLAFVAIVLPAQYETGSVYLLVEPQSFPTDEQIAKKPALGKLDTDNPLLRVASDVVVEVISTRMMSDSVKKSLIKLGADENYLVAPTNVINGGQVIAITGTGTSPQASIQTLNLVTDRMKQELDAMQLDATGKKPDFLITATQVSSAADPTRKVTSTLRSLIVVAAAGLIALFAALSIAEARSPKRKRVVPVTAPRNEVPVAKPARKVIMGRTPPVLPSAEPEQPDEDATTTIYTDAQPTTQIAVDDAAQETVRSGNDFTILMPRMTDDTPEPDTQSDESEELESIYFKS